MVETSIQQALAKLTPRQPEGFIELAQALERTKLSERTFRETLKRGLLPVVRLKGGRRLLFHWPSLESALLRFQKGGIV